METRSLLVGQDVSFKLVVLNSSRIVDVDDFEEWVDVLSFDGNLKLCNEIGHLVNSQVAALIQIEIVEDLLEEGGVTTGQLEDTALYLTEKMRHSLLGDL